MTRPASRGIRQLPSVTLLMFCSGACALVFQIIWLRELRLIFGATTASSAAVVAVFMGGIGVGNAIFGKRLDRAANPLAQYAKLEFGIALSAALTPLLISLTQSCYVSLGGQSQLGSLVSTVVRLLATVVVLGIPTILMGGTLPAAARVVTREDDPHRRGVALVYATNTLGAVLGAALANFVLLELLGSRALLWATCAGNLALATVALAISRQASTAAPPADREENAPAIGRGKAQQQLATESAASARLVYLAAGVVGFAFFLMEIVWYRMLGPLLGGSTYTFGLILCVALAGIGIGGGAYHLVARRIRPSLTLFSITCALEAAFIALPFWAGDSVAIHVLHQLNAESATLASRVFDWFQVAGFVVLPAAIVAGFQFPLLVAIAGSGRKNVSQHVGWTLGANTLGAIAGSLVGGFIALPLLTAPVVWQLVVGMLLALAIAAVLLRPRISEERLFSFARIAAIAICPVAVYWIWQPGPTAVWRHSGIGVSRAQLTGDGKNAERDFVNARRRQTIWEAEGRESSVAITATDSISFIVNGKSDGNAFDDAATQVGLGLVGPLLHANAESALVIGLGTGESAGWLADVGGISHVDVVELEPVVLEMAQRCRELNRDVLNNPKVRVQFNDAREALLTSRDNYDLVVSEPSNPYRAGVATLYTREFYDIVSSKLNEDGLFLQWLQAYEIDSETVRTVLKTLDASFADEQVWCTRSHDLLLVCGKSDQALNYSEAQLQERLSDPVIQSGLQLAWRAKDLEGVLAHYVCGADAISTFLGAGDIAINTDDKNALEYAFARTVGQSTFFQIQELEKLAYDSGDVLPRGMTTIDPAKVLRRRVAMHAALGGDLSANRPGDSKSQELAAFLQNASQGQFAEAFAQAFRPAADCLIEMLAYCRVLAENGQILPEAILAELRVRSPAEVAALRTISSWRQNDAAASEHLLRTLKLLRSDPWADKELLKAVMYEAPRIAAAHGSAAEIHQALGRTFAGYRMEEERRMRKYVIAHVLGTDAIIAGLAELEPHVPWQEMVLRERAQLYGKQGNALAPIAQEEFDLYLDWESRAAAAQKRAAAQR